MNTNAATRATAEAVPEINRRRFLTGTAIAGASVAVAVPAVAAELHDPLLEAIEAFRDGNRRFCALPEDFAPYADEDEAIEATYGPPLEALNEWDDPAQSLAGVREAIRIVLKEGCLGNWMEASLLTAALAYLDQEGGAS